MTEYHAELVEQVLKNAPAGMNLEIPPKIFTEMQGRFLDFVPQTSLLCAYPSLEKYATPVGHVQGGILAAAIDNTFGPFAYLLSGRPCVTVNLSLTYVNAMRAGEGEMVVEAKLVQQTKSLLFLTARLSDEKGRPVCDGTTTMAILPDKKT